MLARRLKVLVAQDYAQSAASYPSHAEPLVYRFLGPIQAAALVATAIDLVHGQLLHNRLARRVRADAERLPFASDSFAGAACAFGLAQSPMPPRPWRRMRGSPRSSAC